MLERKIAEAAVDVTTDLTAKLKIRGDQIQIEQVICNLISNAIEALEDVEQREITVRSYKSDQNDQAIIEVSDTGSGLDEGVSEKVFSKFYSGKREEGGLGLGLYIVKKILELHNGFIDYEVLKGKPTFRIVLPLLS